MRIGKHTSEAVEIRKLKDVISRKNQEIKDIKTECAAQFEKIKNLCFINEYGDQKEKNFKLRKIHEIAADNFSALVKDLVIESSDEENTAKIIELPNTRKSKR